MADAEAFGSFLAAGARAPAAGRFAALLAPLEGPEDAPALAAAAELSNVLLHAASDEALRGLEPGRAAAALLQLLQRDHNGELMLLAVRCLGGLLEALPQAVAAVLAAGAVPQLCQKLIMITYVDVAEECIRALHRLAQDAPGPVLKEGALMAVLAYLDFFAMSVQRRAVEAAALMLRGANEAYRPQVEAGLETLINLLGYDDAAVARGAAEALCTVAELWGHKSELCEALDRGGTLTLALLRVDPSAPHWARAARCLALVCRGSVLVLQRALEAGMADAVAGRYSSFEQAPEVLLACGEMFPPLLPEWSPSLVGLGLVTARRAARRRRVFGGGSLDGSSGGENAEEEEDVPTPEDPRVQLMRDQAALYGNVLSSVVPVFIRMYNEGAGGPEGRQRVLAGLARAVLWASGEQLQGRESELTALLATVLREQTPSSISSQALALQMCRHGLVEAGKEGWDAALRREGAAHAVHQLSERLATTTEMSMQRVGGQEDRSLAVRECAALLQLLGDARDHETEEQKALAACCRSLSSAESMAELCRLLRGGPSAWELQMAGVAQAVAALNAGAAASLWQQLDASGTAATLVEGLLAGLNVPEERGPSAAENGLALKFLTRPLALELAPRPGAPAWPDNGGAAVEPLTTMQRLSSWMGERIDQVARRTARQAEVAERKRLGDNDNKEADMDEQDDDDDDDENNDDEDEEEEVRHMEADEFRDFMTNMLHDLSGLEAEERHAGMIRLKRLVEVFAQSQGSVPQLDPEEEEGAPEAEAQALRQATLEAREAAAAQAANRPSFSFGMGDQCARADETVYAFLSRVLKVRGHALWSVSPIRLEYWVEPKSDSAVPAQPVVDLGSPCPSEQALAVLRQHVTSGSNVRFVSTRLTSAIEAAMCDPLAVAAAALPAWARQFAQRSPWLVPLSTRKELMEKSAFGALRALSDLRVVTRSGGNYSGEGGIFQFGRIPRAKIRVQRDEVWETARTAMKLYGASRSQLEVEFCSEVGTGLGPTLEFFVLCSKELEQRPGMWLPTMGASGLFPAPCREQDAAVLADWQVCGTLMAKSLLDGRLLDLPLSDHFWATMLCGVTRPPLQWLQSLYPEAHRVLAELSSPTGAFQPEDLSLSFTLVGRDDWELRHGGADEALTAANAADYVSLSVDALLGSGLDPVRAAFSAGWMQVMDPTHMRMLLPGEISLLLLGEGESGAEWTIDALRANTKAEHGYDSGSRVLTLLFTVLAERFSPADRRQFLLFATGCPRLPVGGFAALNPRLTVVDKGCERPDEVLPSVMTCVSYLKLPNYSSIDVLEEKLRMAIREAGGFHLS